MFLIFHEEKTNSITYSLFLDWHVEQHNVYQQTRTYIDSNNSRLQRKSTELQQNRNDGNISLNNNVNDRLLKGQNKRRVGQNKNNNRNDVECNFNILQHNSHH